MTMPRKKNLLLACIFMSRSLRTGRVIKARSRNKAAGEAYRQASSSPARHRPGARSARWERCATIVTQTQRKESMNRFGSVVCAALASLAVVLLAQAVSAAHEVPFNGSFDGVVT